MPPAGPGGPTEPSTDHPSGFFTFTGHHGPRLKALVAGALEASHHVGAGAIPTGIANGALIRVWGAQQREEEEEDGEGLGWALAGLSNCPSRTGMEGKGCGSSNSLPARPHTDLSSLE